MAEDRQNRALADLRAWETSAPAVTIRATGSTGTSGAPDTTVSPVTSPTSCDDFDGPAARAYP